MTTSNLRSCAITLLLLFALCGRQTQAADWPMWGGDPSRNMVAESDSIPIDFEPGTLISGTDDIDMSTTKSLKWVAKLGSQTYGNPTISNGRVFVGTNNEAPRDPAITDDRGVIMCLDEETGELQWQLLVPKLGAGKVSDWEYLGICSSPAVDGDLVFVVTNRCEVLALDVHGFSNGNDGPFLHDAGYVNGSYFEMLEQDRLSEPAEVATDSRHADIVWRYDMREELGVFPHNIASNSALVVGDRVYVATSNGVNWSHINIPNPNAPSLIALDRNTGELIGEEASGISRRMFHCNWSSPAYAEIDGTPQLIFGAGDGFTYGFDPVPVEDEEGFMVFKELWRYDCNPPHYRKNAEGEPIKYATYKGPSEVVSTPIVIGDHVYVAIGQDPEHGEGLGNLVCIDATGRGDITETGKVWEYSTIDRTISTASVHDALIYVADYEGLLHCLDAATGEEKWVHDTESRIWGSTLVADGKVFLGNEDGVLFVMRTGPQAEVLREIEFTSSLYSTPVVANDVLYIATQTHLYAIADDDATKQ